MRVPVIVPSVGELIGEVTVVRWLLQVGDPVRADEVLVEVTTDKVDVVLPSPASGRLSEICAAAGSTVAVGGELAAIETD